MFGHFFVHLLDQNNKSIDNTEKLNDNNNNKRVYGLLPEEKKNTRIAGGSSL